jgi:hypothetical protein
MDIEKKRAEYMTWDRERLADYIINRTLNNFVARYADYGDDEDGVVRDHDKRIPYIGWFWRDVDFASREPYIPIGNCGEFIGFMENNKWDYPQRRLTPDEVKQVVDIVCEAHRLNREGGLLSDIEKNTIAKLEELWPVMQTFKIGTTGYWIYGPQGQVGHADDADAANTMIVMLQEAAPGLRYWKEPV